MKKQQHARLYLPDPAVGQYLAMAVERDTRGLALTAAERFNYYPASPFPTLSWVWQGELQMVEDVGESQPQMGAALPDMLFSGPYSRPSASWSAGPVHALMVGLYPEFVTQLLGIQLETYFDRVIPLEQLREVMPTWFWQLCQQVRQQPEQAFACLQQQLQQQLNADQASLPPRTLSGWLRAMLLRASFSQAGSSLRQWQRHIKQLTGQSQRDLQLYEKTEQAFSQFARQATPAGTEWAMLAADSGFADQSHLGREVRRITGFSPKRLQQMMAEDESFWFYRLLWQHHRSLE
ncbi:MAG: AraC family transcriptional regulator [Chitinivorax sp.]